MHHHREKEKQIIGRSRQAKGLTNLLERYEIRVYRRKGIKPEEVIDSLPERDISEIDRFENTIDWLNLIGKGKDIIWRPSQINNPISFTNERLADIPTYFDGAVGQITDG